MGSLISGIFGGGAGNIPTAPTVNSVYTPGNAQQATTNTQNAIGQQQNIAAQQQAFINQLQGQSGLNNQGIAGNNLQSSYNQLGNVSSQLQGVANGTGPNPAQALLAQQTGANVAQQAALMAGQRGAGANVGLESRQAAMQGANTQQQAVGQAATNQANQSLNALNSMGNLASQQAGVAGQQGSLGGQQVGQQQTGLSNLAAQNQAVTGANQAQQNAQLGAIQGVNQTQAQQYGTQANAQVQANQQAQSGVGGLLGGVGSVLSGGLTGGLIGAAKGLASGGQVGVDGTPAVMQASSGPKSYWGKYHAGGFTHDHTVAPMASGGKVEAMLSPGEKYLPPADAQAVASGQKDPMEGETVPGKAKVKGDSLKNDVVPASLEEGGVVIPRSVLESKNPHEAAAKFVAAHLKKNKGKK
jgi:hypothetical protein